MVFTKVSENLYLFQNKSYYDVVVGAIILPSKVVMIDSGTSKEKVAEFRKYVEKETGKKCEVLFITHCHGDHLGGVQVFSDCRIITAEADAIKSRKQKNGWANTQIDETGHLEIADGDVKVIFKQTGGHSSDSAYIYCPNYKILFAGDNLFENMYSYGQDASSNPDVWVSVLEEYLSLDVDQYIPGHQNICNKQIIQKYIDFIQMMKETMLKLHSEGKNEEEILSHCEPFHPFTESAFEEKLGRLKNATLQRWYNVWING